MADLSNLTIQITARTSDANNSIDKLIEKLSKLNKALNDYTGNEANIKGLFKLASGLSQVGDAEKALDSAKIASFASALGDLAKSGGKLSDLNFSALGTGLRNLQSVHIGVEKFAGIKALSESLGKLTGANYEKAKTALPNLARSLSSFQHINIPNFGGKIEALAAGLGKLGQKSIVRAQDINKIADGLRQFQGIQVPQVDGLKSLALSLSKFGNKSMTQAIQQMPLLAESFTNLMRSVSAAPQVSMQTVRFAEAMAKLATTSKMAGTSMKSVINGTSLFKNAILSTIPAMNRTQRHTFSLAAMFGKLYASYFLVIRAFRGLGKAISVSSSLAEVENVVASVFGNMTDKLDEFADTSMYKFGLAELSAKQFASRFQAMGNAMGITAKQVADSTDFLSTKLVGQKREIEGVEDSYSDLGSSMADMSINLTKLVSDYASFFNMDYEDVAKDFESIFTGSTRPMRAYGIDLTNATLQEWALKNGLDADVKAMTQAEKSMLRYQYVMAQSGKVMNDYQITMNNWANVTRTIGQQFTKLGSIIGQGLINTFKPVLIAFRGFMNTIIDLTQKSLNAVGKLLGWQIEIEEVGFAMDDGMEDYADALDDAAGNAKKLNAQLRSIDELNNLSSSKNGSGSGDNPILGAISGGESDALGGKFRFEKYKSDIDSWFELGKRISDKIRDALNSIKWENIFHKARNFSKNIADYLNGVISPESFYAVGRTVASAINTAIEAAYSFGTHFDFKNLGESIANGINGFFENFNFTKLAKTINTWVDGLKKAIKTIIKKVKWGSVFGGMFDFFSSLSIDSYAIGAFANLPSIILGVATASKILPKLSTQFGKLSSRIEDVVFAYNAFYDIPVSKTVKLNAGIKEITKNLTKTQKTLIGIGSAVGEFALLSDGVRKITADTDNLGEAIAEMIAGIAVGAAGLTAVIGFPYGLIAAGVIGITGAVVGMKKGFEELNNLQLADSIQKAFSNDEGVPLDKYLDSVNEKIVSFSDGFELIEERSNTLNNAKKNIEEVALNIQMYVDKMNLATETTEEDVAELNRLFDELKTAMSDKLNAAAAVLYTTFGENGVVSRYFEGSAEVLEEAKNTAIGSATEIDKKLSKLYEDIQTVDYGSEEWNNYYTQIMELVSGLNTVDEALLDIQAQAEKTGIEMSSYFGDEGLRTDEINSKLSELFESAKKAEDAMTESVEAAKEAAADLGNSETYMFLESGLPTALSNMNKDSSAEIKKATDMLQTELIGGLETVVNDARADWEENKFWYTILGKDEATFTRDRAAEYVEENIIPISEEIEKGFSQLGVDGAGWADEAAMEMMTQLFYDLSNFQNLIDRGDLNMEDFNPLEGLFEEDNWLKGEMVVAANKIGDVAAENVVKGYLEGFSNVPQSEYNKAVEGTSTSLEDAFAEVNDSHSPAKRFNPQGENIILGVLQGFENVDFLAKMREWWESNVKPFFAIDTWKDLGKGASDGLLPQIDSMLAVIKNNFILLSSDITNVFADMVVAINNELEGIETPRFEITGKFDLSKNEVPNIDVKYYAQGGFPQTGSLFFAGEAGTELLGTVGGRTAVASNGEITGISDAIRSTSSEEVALLRQQNQLLQAILQKEGLTDSKLFRSVRNSAREWEKMTGNPAF